ncbi:hypothetical protein GIB67_042360 [Kingdonia uniflora]|uniref:Uncharacterized protein n=1 Tax=Kingdonia uniflora TaxID=39325 RepID=A0A7J7LUT1_9MAGN|nr:hypothetical protein GIB67_042360 [Kingdonia uniflora]
MSYVFFPSTGDIDQASTTISTTSSKAVPPTTAIGEATKEIENYRVDALFNFQKSPNETLEAFTKRFLGESRKVENLDCANAVLTYSNALPDNNRVKEYIVLHKPKTLEEMLSKVNRYIDLERLHESNCQGQASTTNHSKPRPSPIPIVAPVSQETESRKRPHFDVSPLETRKK